MQTTHRRNGLPTRHTSWGITLARVSALGLLITGLHACKTMETVTQIAETAAAVIPVAQGGQNTNTPPPQQQTGYPQQGTYPQQPNYPQQPGTYPQQPSYPQQPAYPQQPKYPQQEATYPQQQSYPQQPAYPQQPDYPVAQQSIPNPAQNLPPVPVYTPNPAPVVQSDNIPVSVPVPTTPDYTHVEGNATMPAPVEAAPVNPDDPDSDNLNAQWEEAFAYSATERDSDKDGITDDKEDFDSDTWVNLVEINEGYDPKNPKNHPIGLADMVSFELDQTPVAAGGKLGYTITVGNLQANRSLNNMQILMRLPKGISFHYTRDADPDISSNVGCPSWVCVGGNEVVWKLDSLAAGESRNIVINADVAKETAANSSLETSLRISADGFNPISLKRVTGVVAKQPVHFTLNPSIDPVVPGDSFSYTLSLGNADNNALNNTELKLVLPEGIIPGVISEGGKLVDSTIIWPVGSLAPGASLQRNVSVTLDKTASEAATLNAVAQLRHDGGTELDRERRASVTVSERLPLDLRFEQALTPVANAGTLRYQLHLGNTASVSSLNDVEVLMRLPTGVSFHYTRDAEPDISGNVGCPSWICTGGNEVFWRLGNLAPGENNSIQVDVTVDSADKFYPGSLIQPQLTVTAEGLGDVVHQMRTTAVINKPPVQFALTPSADPVAPGASFVYSLDLGNPGNTALNNTQVSLNLPIGVTAASISDGGTQDGSVVTWQAGNIAAGTALKRSVNATLSSAAVEGASFDAVAQVRHDGGLELDREAHASATVSAPLPLSVNYRIEEGSGKIGGTVKFIIDLDNSNTVSTLNDVKVLMRVPTGVSFHYTQNAEPDISGNVGCPSWVCQAGNEVFWNIGKLAPGAHSSIEVEAKVDPTAVPGALIQAPIIITAAELGDVITQARTINITAP